MKPIAQLLSNPVSILALVVIISICIIIVIFITLCRLENQKKVTRAALELKKITNSIRAGLVHFIAEDNCRILYASKGFYSLLGYEKNEAKAMKKLNLLDFIDARDIHIIHDIHKSIKEDTVSLEVRMITKEGSTIYVLMSGNCEVGKDGKHTISVVFVDISQQKHMQEMLLLEGERYRIASELSKDVLFEYHIKTDDMVYTEKFKDLYGRNLVSPLFKKSNISRKELIHPDDWGIYLEFCQELAEGKSIIEKEFRIKDRLGEFIWCQILGKTIYDDDKVPIRVIGKMVNVDIQKKELEALEYKATRDPLTGVYNKEVTIKKIDKFINGSKNARHMLMFIDFDDFKKVNDNYGHLLGDKVLTYVISRIKDVFSEGEIIGRIGGDEFVVFGGNITNMDEITQKAATLMKALDTTFTCNSKEIPISGSIGIAIYPQDGLHYEQLMECADKALYHVKKQGKKNYLLYSPSI